MSSFALSFQVPINLQLPDGATNQFPLATVLDSTNTPVAGSPFTLAHLGHGNYATSSLFMPDSPWITVSIQVFEDSGFTQPSNVYGITSEIITLDTRMTAPWSDPGINNVRAGVTYQANSILRTGTMSTNVYRETFLNSSGAIANEKLKITIGDVVTFQFIAMTDTDVFDVTGATFESRMLGSSGDDVVLPNSKHTPNPNKLGYFALSMSSEDTARLVIGPGQSILVKIMQGSSVFHFHGRKLIDVLDADFQGF